MSGTPVLVVIPDLDLRRSVEFVLRAHGHEPIAEVASSDSVPLAIVDEVSLGDLLARPVLAARLIVLSSHARPAEAPPAWWWLEKPHLGAALELAMAEAHGELPRDSARSQS